MSAELGTNPDIWEEYCSLFAKFTFSIQDELLCYTANRSSGVVLDAGTGVGKLIPYLLEQPQVTSIIGIENNPFMAEKGKQMIASMETQRVSIVEHDIFKLDTLNIKKVDTITCLNVIYSLLENPREFLQKAYDFLADDGRIIISNPMPTVDLDNDITPKLSRELEGNEKEEFDRFIELNQKLLGNNTGFSPQLFSQEEMETLLEEIGFTIERSVTTHYFGNNVTVIARKISSSEEL